MQVSGQQAALRVGTTMKTGFETLPSNALQDAWVIHNGFVLKALLKVKFIFYGAYS